MSAHHAAGLREFEKGHRKHEIVALRDMYPEGEDDVVWIRALAANGNWVVISGDLRIWRNPVQKAVWKEAGLTTFFFGDAWNQKKFWNKAADPVEWWPRIMDKAKVHPKGYGFEIPNNAKQMRQIFPEQKK